VENFNLLRRQIQVSKKCRLLERDSNLKILSVEEILSRRDETLPRESLVERNVRPITVQWKLNCFPFIWPLSASVGGIKY